MKGRINTLSVLCLCMAIGYLTAQSDETVTDTVWDIVTLPPSYGDETTIVESYEYVYLQKYYNLTVGRHPDLRTRIMENPSFSILMAKAKRSVKLELRLLEWAELVGQMSDIDAQLRSYVQQADSLEPDTLADYVTWCVSHDPGAISGILNKIKSLVHPVFRTQGLLKLVFDLLEEDSDVCNLQMSPHQLIYDMYNTIALTEIKGYAMMQFSWMLLRIYGRGNFTQEASLTRQRYAERTGQTAAAARSALAMASRDLYRCEPARHTNETYAEVTRLLQGYIENEVDMNTDGTCRENCAYYSLAESHTCFKELYCSKQPKCRGRIIDCQFFDSDMWVCPSSNPNRRYDWIEYENGRTLGKVGYCKLGTTKVDSWWRWTLTHCSYCFCLCEDEPSIAERYFSLREAVSDTESNKVVTGMKLVKIDKVFHIQIYEGVLRERGFVEASEEVRILPLDPSDRRVMPGVDYHQLTYEKRAIDLDELDSPQGHVLTGARFRMIGAHLHFEIRSTPFNYTTGKLHPEKSQWISNDNTEGSNIPRSRLNLVKPDVPTRVHTPQRIDSKHDQYIEFTNTDFDADAAQSTVPFIDVQPVLTSRALNSKGATLNSGAGLYHRGSRGSGGFIALKLRTYDYSRHIKAEPPPADFVDEAMETTEFAPIVN